MTADRAGGADLLERAVAYALGTLALVTPSALARPTPCREWDLLALLDHLADSLGALREAVEPGRISLHAAQQPDGDPVANVRDHARRLLGAWSAGEPDAPTAVGDLPITRQVVSGTGAVEVTVHGWDIAEACGASRPIPGGLAEDLLPLLPLVVTEADRPDRFADPVPVPAPRGPADRLLGLVGRHPC